MAFICRVSCILTADHSCQQQTNMWCAVDVYGTARMATDAVQSIALAFPAQAAACAPQCCCAGFAGGCPFRQHDPIRSGGHVGQAHCWPGGLGRDVDERVAILTNMHPDAQLGANVSPTCVSAGFLLLAISVARPLPCQQRTSQHVMALL